tara:strand:- start:4835 stop:6763 length:1929 start_codon:yes stop_codon:yes gene_type:complete
MKKNLYLFELSDVFANQVYLPYSSGVVWSFCKNKEEIKNNYVLKNWFYHRDEIKNIVSKINKPDVLGFSCFMWNWSLNCQIAKAVKKEYPDCLIVFGGQHQPMDDRNKGFFAKYPFVDLLVHHEGEQSFYEILLERLGSQDYSRISGITINNDGKELRTLPRSRLENIEGVPSPYLDGSFDELLLNNESGFKFHASVESARGCPFSCAFCEIGEKYYSKIRTSYDKTKKEIDWLSKNKIEYVTDANSNFGLYYDKDYDLALYVKDKIEKTNYPEAYRVTWAKGKADKVLNIAKVFESVRAQKGMTIALQSMNPDVLKAVRRRNIDNGKLQNFIEMYEKEDISSYVELIWGLPEETLDSFMDGVLQIIDYGYHNYLDIHLMMLLPNAPIGSKKYIENYGVKTSTTQPRFSHRDLPTNLVEDTIEIVTTTNACNLEEWKYGHQFRWLIIFGHYLGALQFISRGLNKAYGISYKDFYINLLNFSKGDIDSFIGSEYDDIDNCLSLILENKRHWGFVVEGAGTINWSVDETTRIKIAKNPDLFYEQVKEYVLKTYPNLNYDLVDDLFIYQKSRLSSPFVNYPYNKKFSYNIHDIIEEGSPLQKSENVIEFNSKNYNNDLFLWAKEALWFGRRVGAYKTKAKKLENK